MPGPQFQNWLYFKFRIFFKFQKARIQIRSASLNTDAHLIPDRKAEGKPH